MQASHSILFSRRFRCSAFVVAGVALLGGCYGSGPKITFVEENPQLSVNENSVGTVWKSQGTIAGSGSGITYSILPGKDGELFYLDTVTGALSFRQPADFETPLDINNDNAYEVDIKAIALVEDRGSEAPREPGHFIEINSQQHVRIQVKDVSNPILTIIKPQQYQNVGNGNLATVETVAQWFDAESNSPIKGDGVLLNGVPLQQDAEDPKLWKGSAVVPEGGTTLSTIGYIGTTPKVRVLTQLFNKRDAIKPSFMAVNPGAYLMLFDPLHNLAAKANLKTNLWQTYIKDDRFHQFTHPMYDFNSSYQTIYVISPYYGLIAFQNVADSRPNDFYAGTIPNVVDMMVDSTNQRVIVVSKTQVSGADKYQILAVPTESLNGFVNKKGDFQHQEPAVTTLLWDIPNGVVPGAFKYFNYHRANKIYIFADERITAGKLSTFIQGYGEDGAKRFEAVVGPDISNLAVNNKSNYVYVAENHSTSAGKLKAIDINTGEVTDLVKSFGDSAVGGYSDIRMDNTNQRLYIGDAVSDTVFSVDLSTQVLSDLQITKMPEPPIVN